MNIPVLPTGDLSGANRAKSGDSVVFRALVDCIMVMSDVLKDVIRINPGRPVSAQYCLLAGLTAEPSRRQRLWSRLMAMAEIGRAGNGRGSAGVRSRIAAARRLLFGWACECGLECPRTRLAPLSRIPVKGLSLRPC